MGSDVESSARAAVAFHNRYSMDREGGEAKPLSHYLALFPDHREVVVREYLTLEGAPTLSDAAARPSQAAPNEDPRERLGPYRLLRELGRGGQATVHLAEDTRLGRPVALKVLPALKDPASQPLLRFRREAAVASRLEHPAICSVYDVGQERGLAYIAMRYVEGETLAQKITAARGAASPEPRTVVDVGADAEACEPSPEPTPTPSGAATRAEILAVVRLIEEAARALHTTHEAGVIHRDIKSGNIMVTAEGKPVILDFGLAAELDGDQPTVTHTGDLFGTPAYMSPEQLMAQRIRLDRRTGVYSLGVTLYECLTLRRPFEAPTREGLYQQILTRDPPDPRRLNPAIASDLKVVIETALEKDRDRRYQTALDLAEDLRRMRERQPIVARPVGPLGRIRRWAQRHPGVAIASTMAFFFLTAGLVTTWFMKLDSDDYASRAVANARRAEASAEEADHNAALAVACAEEIKKQVARVAAREETIGDLQRRIDRLANFQSPARPESDRARLVIHNESGDMVHIQRVDAILEAGKRIEVEVPSPSTLPGGQYAIMVSLPEGTTRTEVTLKQWAYRERRWKPDEILDTVVTTGSVVELRIK